MNRGCFKKYVEGLIKKVQTLKKKHAGFHGPP